MGIILVLGPNSSGKSLFSEKLAVEQGEPRIYVATMVPQTEDNLKRIEKHRIQRADKGFVTIEEPWELQEMNISSDSVVLLEDVSNLLANGIFQHHVNGKDTLQQIKALSEKCKCLIAVSIAGLIDEGYDEETSDYIHQLNWLNQELSKMSDIIYEMRDGVAYEKTI